MNETGQGLSRRGRHEKRMERRVREGLETIGEIGRRRGIAELRGQVPHGREVVRGHRSHGRAGGHHSLGSGTMSVEVATWNFR